MAPLRTSFKIGGASGAFLDQAGRRGAVKPVLVARASRHVAIQRRVPGAHPGVPVFLKVVLNPTAPVPRRREASEPTHAVAEPATLNHLCPPR
jgi:hypothetical protein